MSGGIIFCNLCLATNVKMYNLKNKLFKKCVDRLSVVIKVLKNKRNTKHQLHACYECLANMIKFSDFAERCIRAESALRLLDFYQNLDAENIKNINRNLLSLESKITSHINKPESIIELTYSEEESPNSEEIIDVIIKNEKGDEISSQNFEINNKDEKYVESDGSLKSEYIDYSENNLMMQEDPDKNSDIESDPNDTDYIPDNGKNITALKIEDNVTKNIDEELSSEPMMPKKRKHYTKVKTKVSKKKLDNKSNMKINDNNESKVKAKKQKKVEEELLEKCFDKVTLSHETQVENMEKRRNSELFANARFKCFKCYKFFQREVPYNNHLLEHDPAQGPYECPICKRRYKDQNSVNAHVSMNHQRVFRCRLCQFTCNVRKCLSHMMTHEEFTMKVIQFKCPQCDFVTDCEASYRSHRRRGHGTELPCVFCGRSYLSGRGLALHRNRAHPRDKSDAGQFPCADCDVTFASAHALSVHLMTSRRHTRTKKTICMICCKEFENKTELAAHNRELHKPKFPRQCFYCEETVADAKENNVHLMSRHPKVKVKHKSKHLCEICGKGFKCPALLKCHSARHGGSRDWSCTSDDCRATFYDHYQLKVHVKLVHSQSRPFTCPLCHLNFKFNMTLKRHMVVHTGERPYKCTICEKSFTQAGSRDLHVRTVHYRQPHPPRDRKKKCNNTSVVG